MSWRRCRRRTGRRRKFFGSITVVSRRMRRVVVKDSFLTLGVAKDPFATPSALKDPFTAPTPGRPTLRHANLRRTSSSGH